jgi:nitrous oxidase accessory protein NosD
MWHPGWARDIVEQLAGDASGAGVHPFGGDLSSLDLSVDTNGRPYLAWQESGPGAAAHVGFRGNLLPPFAPERTFVADGSAGKTIAELLAAHSLGAGDAIVIHGSWSEDVTITAAHAGVAIFAAPGSTMDGTLTITADDVLVQGVHLSGVLSVWGATGFTLRESIAGQVTISQAVAAQIVHNQLGAVTIQGSSEAVIEHNQLSSLTLGGADQLLVRFNTIAGGQDGIDLDSPSSGQIAGNTVSGSSVGLRISAAFAGAIVDNEIRNSTVGVQYDARAPLSGNRIVNNTTGAVATVSDLADALGFDADAEPNDHCR